MTQSKYNFICMVKHFKTLYGFQCGPTIYSVALFCFGLFKKKEKKKQNVFGSYNITMDSLT